MNQTTLVSMKPRICLIAPGLLPVPATQGGAIETLITNLIQENERHGELALTVVTSYDSKALTLAHSIHNTKFIWISKVSSLQHILFKLSRALIRRIRRDYTVLPSIYYRQVLTVLGKRMNDFDAVIVEGGPSNAPHSFIQLCNDHLWYHLHFTPGNTPIGHGYSTVLSVSDFAANAWRNHCQDSTVNIFTVHNGIDIKRFDREWNNEERETLRRSIGLNLNDFVVLYCGRIIREKGVLELLHAIELVNDDRVKLMIVGSSNFGPSEQTPYTDEVQQTVNRLGNRVVYTGYVPNDQLYRYYKSADIQAFPSIWEEAAGLVGVEGMASGLPLIVTHSGGIQEYVSSECSIVVERGENLISSLAQAIITLRDNPERRKRMSKAGMEHARLFDTFAMYHQFVDACKKVCNA